MNTHVLDDDDKGERWLVIVELGASRAMPTFEARIPKAANVIDLKAFLSAVELTIRRKMSGR